MKEHEKIKATALKVLEAEQQAVQGVRAAINEAFVEAVLAAVHCKGRLVITGIGKSALIAQKIAATLNSTGTPAHFMHGADALHGDLGMLTASDLLLILSKSGETPEIKAILPSVQRIGCALMCITAAPESTLARASKFVLLTPNLPEADGYNLAPTTSTIAQLALGDAFAMATMEQKGFNAQDFARYHPGGSLGKQLLLRVSELAERHAKPAISSTATVQEAVIAIAKGRLGAVAVLDADEKVVGILTDGDLRKMLENGATIDTAQLHEIMGNAPKCIPEHALAMDALHLMREKSISQVIVLDQHQKYAGMVHFHDLLREGLG
jgi:arabinose-5-phosphate isomerase